MATGTSSTVLKAFDILGLFHDRAHVGVAECARLLGLAKPTAHRLLVTLEHAGALERTGSGRYRMALWMFELGAQVPLLRVLYDQAEPLMGQLAMQTRMQTHLAVRHSHEVVYLLMLNRDARRRVQTPIGHREPLYATALGKVLLSDAPKPVLDSLLDKPLERLTAYTVTQPKALRAQLATVRRSGFGYSIEERRIGIAAIATGIHDREGRVVAALSVGGRVELNRQRLSTLKAPLRRTADLIEENLGELPRSIWLFQADPARPSPHVPPAPPVPPPEPENGGSG